MKNEQVSLREFRLEIEAMLRICFDATVSREGETILLTLSNGQRFALSAAEKVAEPAA